MLKILIKRSKKDILSQTKDLVSKIQDESKCSPNREPNAVPLDDQGIFYALFPARSSQA